MTLNPICFIRQYGENLELRINSFSKDGNRIFWQKKGKPGTVKSFEADSSIVTLKGFRDNGWYDFFTENDDGRAHKVTAYISVDSPDEELLKVIKLSGEDVSDEVFESLISEIKQEYKKNPQRPLICAIKKVLDRNSGTGREKSFLLLLMRTWERYRNTISVQMNRENGLGEIFKAEPVPEILSSTGNIGCRIDILSDNDEFVPFSVHRGNIPYGRNPKIYIRENVILRITAIDEITGEWLGVFYHYQPEDEETAQIWKKQYRKKEALKRIGAELLFYDFLGTDFSDKEKEWYMLGNLYEPDNAIFSSPCLEQDSHGNIIISFRDNIFMEAYLKGKQNKLVLCFVQRDLFKETGWENRVLVKREKISFSPSEYFLQGEVLFYLKDGNDNQVSGISIIDIDGIDNEEYQEKVRLLETAEAGKRILRRITESFPDDKSSVESYLEEAKYNPEVRADNIHLFLLEKLNRNYRNRKVIKLMNEVAEDYLSQHNFDRNFFRENLPVYYRNENRLAFPALEKEYVISRWSFAEGDDSASVSYRYCREPQEFYVNEYGIRVFFCIDIKTGAESGFLIVDSGIPAHERVFTNGIDYDVV